MKAQLQQYNDLLKEIEELDQRIQPMDKSSRIYGVLAERKSMCEDQIQNAENFIDNIPDGVTKAVFVLRYIEQLSWTYIARMMKKADESYPRKVIHDRYLNNFKYQS